MKWQFTKYLSSTNEIRRRSTQLLYLCFLVLLFVFMPSLRSGKTPPAQNLGTLKNNTQQLGRSNALLILEMLPKDSKAHNELSTSFSRIERLSNKNIQLINVLSSQVRNRDSVNSFFDLGLVNEYEAEQLYQSLYSYRAEILGILGIHHESVVMSLLNISKFSTNEEGKLRPFYELYFKRRSADEIQAYLNTLYVSVVNLESLCYLESSKRILAEYSAEVDISEHLIYLLEAQQISDGFSSSKNTYRYEIIGNRNNKRLYLEKLIKDQYATQEVILFNTYFNANEDKLLVKVEHMGETEYFSLTKPGAFIYFPQYEGAYRFIFEQENTLWTSDIQVYAPEKEQNNIPLALGVENTIPLPEDIADLPFELQFESTNGSVGSANKKIYIKPTQLGTLNISASCKTPYGMIRIGSYSFEVEAPRLPVLHIGNVLNGGSMSKEEILQQSKVSIKRNYSTDYQIIRFQLSVFNPQTGTSSRIFHNQGENFSASIVNMLQDVKSGDRLLIDEIVTSVGGTETITLAPYLLNIK